MSGCRYRCCRELDGIGGVGENVTGDGFVTVIGTLHGDPLLAGFVKLQLAEARLIQKKRKC